jgi:hypothetical protein
MGIFAKNFDHRIVNLEEKLAAFKATRPVGSQLENCVLLFVFGGEGEGDSDTGVWYGYFGWLPVLC